MVIFHSYVKLPEGNDHHHQHQTALTPQKKGAIDLALKEWEMNEWYLGAFLGAVGVTNITGNKPHELGYKTEDDISQLRPLLF